MNDLKGKIAVVTGGGSGIGRAGCLELARLGVSVVIVDVDAAAAAATASLLGPSPSLTVAADVSRSADVENYVAAARKRFGRIDIFFNNAGIEGPILPIPDYPEEAFDQVMAINVRGIFLGLKHVMPVMLAQERGSIINTSSVCGMTGTPGFAGYVASKHAVIGLTRVAAAEGGRRGVRVNAICPGPIETRMMREIEKKCSPDDPAETSRQIVAKNPSGRYGTPDEVARIVAFLASEASSYVNGAAWTVDGGRTAI